MDLNSLAIEGDKGLFDRLIKITDPRKAMGIRHNQTSILAIAICACLSGCRSFAAIGQWSCNLTQELRKRFKCRRSARTGKYIAPSEPTIRRVLQKTDSEEVDQMINEWLDECNGEAIAVDGKTLRESRNKNKKAVHLLSALLHKEGVVIVQKEVDSKTNEIKAFKPLLENIDIKGKSVTADAMHAQKKHAKYIKGQDGDYYIEFPYLGQVFRIERITTDLNGEKRRKEIAYGITSLSTERAKPEKVLDLVRGHWSIENSLHWVRDVTFDEDRSQVRTGSGPRIMASLRNLAISLFRRCGSLNINVSFLLHEKNWARIILIMRNYCGDFDVNVQVSNRFPFPPALQKRGDHPRSSW